METRLIINHVNYYYAAMRTTIAIVRSTAQSLHRIATVEPPNKGHFGVNSFVPCREVVSSSEMSGLLSINEWNAMT